MRASNLIADLKEKELRERGEDVPDALRARLVDTAALTEQFEQLEQGGVLEGRDEEGNVVTRQVSAAPKAVM